MSPTAIEWTEETWNPVTGCTKVSAGCDNCYAERITERFHGPGSFEQIVLHEDRLEKPLRWRKPRTVFVNSMSDLFHADVSKEFIARVFATMALTPRHTFQVLTKRPSRANLVMWDAHFPELVREAVDDILGDYPVTPRGVYDWPLPNVWLGVSVEDQETAVKRIPELLRLPAAVRFLSCEPLLSPLTFRWAPWAPLRGANHLDGLRALDWIIVGGESGLAARPMDDRWVRTIRDECVEAGVPFFFKQWGGRTPKANGRELDGRTWDEMPSVQHKSNLNEESS